MHEANYFQLVLLGAENVRSLLNEEVYAKLKCLA